MLIPDRGSAVFLVCGLAPALLFAVSLPLLPHRFPPFPLADGSSAPLTAPVRQIGSQLSTIDAFDLGALSANVSRAARGQRAAMVKAALPGIERVLDGVSEDALASEDGLRELVRRQHEADGVGPLQRLAGVFSIVNFLWLLSILLGLIAASFILVVLGTILAPLCATFYQAVLLPLYRLSRPFLGWALFAGAAWIVVRGLRLPVGSSHSFFVTFTGIMIGVMSLFATIALYLKSEGSPNGALILSLIVNATLCLIFGGLAPHFRSALLAYPAVAAVFGALGFSIIPVPLGLFIGFESKSAMARTMSASLVILAAAITGKATGWITRDSALHVFLGPTSVFGPVVSHLGMLISASCMYSNSVWTFAQARMLATLVVSFAAGSFFAIPGMVNVSGVFTALFLVDKFAESRWLYRTMFGPWLAILAGSVFLYAASYYLTANPHVITGLFVVLD